MDRLIDHVNQKILIKRGYDPMPLDLYSFYHKTDEDILKDIKNKNEKISKYLKKNVSQKDIESQKKDRSHGTKMVLEQYIKWLDLEDENLNVSLEKTPASVTLPSTNFSNVYTFYVNIKPNDHFRRQLSINSM